MPRHPFDTLMELDSEYIRLDCAALHLARDAFPGMHMNSSLRALDALATRVAQARPGITATSRYQALRSVLVDDLHFRTAPLSRRSDMNNLFLNTALQHRRGVPTVLAIIWIEVGRRLKWHIAAVGFPNQLLVRIDDEQQLVLADPGQQGRSMSIDDCRVLFEGRSDDSGEFDPDLLAPLTAREVLLRLLTEMRLAFIRSQDWPRLECTLQRLAALDPPGGEHLQELAALRCRRGDLRGAYAHLSAYLQRHAQAPDRQLVASSLRKLGAALVAQN